MYQSRLSLPSGSSRNLLNTRDSACLFENDFNVPVVHYFSNFTCTLFICVGSSDMMCNFFLPLQLKKRRTPFFCRRKSIMFYLYIGVSNQFLPVYPHDQCVLFLINFTVFCRPLICALKWFFSTFSRKTPCCHANNWSKNANFVKTNAYYVPKK